MGKKARAQKKSTDKLAEVAMQSGSDTEGGDFQIDLDKNVKVKDENEDSKEVSPVRSAEPPSKGARKPKVKPCASKGMSEVKPKDPFAKTPKVLKAVNKEPGREESIKEEPEEDREVQEVEMETKPKAKVDSRRDKIPEQKVKKEPASAAEQYKMKIEQLQKQVGIYYETQVGTMELRPHQVIYLSYGPATFESWKIEIKTIFEHLCIIPAALPRSSLLSPSLVVQCHSVFRLSAHSTSW